MTAITDAAGVPGHGRTARKFVLLVVCCEQVSKTWRVSGSQTGGHGLDGGPGSLDWTGGPATLSGWTEMLQQSWGQQGEDWTSRFAAREAGGALAELQ